MKYIYNEPLVGTVDGINKEFTTLNVIYNIEEVYIGGASYRNVTFSGNTVIFGDAPTIGMSQPTIDYFYDDGVIKPSAGELTLGSVIDETYDILGIERTSKVYKLSTVTNWINKLLIRINNMKIFQPRRRYYTFNKAQTWSAIGYNPTFVEIGDRAFIPTIGAYILDYSSEPVIYNGYVDGKLAGNPDFTYKTGASTEILYKVPSNVKGVLEVRLNGNPVDFNLFNINGASYLRIINDLEGLVNVTYQSKSAELELDEDIIDFPYEYSNVISLGVAYNVLQNREDDRAIPLKREYMEELRRYKGYKSRTGARYRIRNTSLTGI